MLNRLDTEVTLSPQEISLILDFFPRGLVAFDLEMTGLSPILDKIIEIAAVKIDKDGKISFYHSLVNPLITIPEYTIEFHKLTNDSVKNAPTLKKPLKEFMDFYQDLPLVAHNAQFDASYLVRGHHEFNFTPSDSDVYDSCRFARTLYKKNHPDDKPKDFKLSGLATFYDIELNHHQALDDAMVCLKIFAQSILKMQLNQRSDQFKTMSYLFKLSQFKKASAYNLPKQFDGLKELVPKQTEIEIIYKGGTSPLVPRVVRPISLLPMPQGLMLYAFCLKEEMNKHFLVSRIKEFKLLKDDNK